MAETTTAVATDNRPPMVVMRSRLQEREAELRAALGPDIPVDTFVRAVMTSVALNPDILACTWQSVWNSCLKACRDGLLPDGIDAAIVPFKSTANYIPMYQGLLRRFRRSGQFKWITANVVRQGEEFMHYIDENGEHFRHVPGGDTNAPVAKVYALATTKEGGVFVAVMSKAEVDKIKAMSKTTREDSPWKMHEQEMQKKTLLRRLCKMLPSARDLMGEDDEPPTIDLPATAQPPQLTAVPSPAAQSVTPTAADGEIGGEQDQQEDNGPSKTDDASDDPAAADAPAESEQQPAPGPFVDAYERGKADKARGHQRKAVPPEFREPTRTREALAWQAGFDGADMPSFPTPPNSHQ
jgi:recombination protein RecT